MESRRLVYNLHGSYLWLVVFRLDNEALSGSPWSDSTTAVPFWATEYDPYGNVPTTDYVLCMQSVYTAQYEKASSGPLLLSLSTELSLTRFLTALVNPEYRPGQTRPIISCL